MQLPEQIGKYRISSVLGQGAMGVVYKGFDPHIQRTVAIKTIHRNLLGEDAAAADSIAARFRNEARAVGRIAHPGVVAIYEFGEDERCAYIAMEYVEGRNLEQVLAGTPLLPESQLLGIMDQLLAALEVAHGQGVWHRDIKPANLIVTATGQVKLTDFGIARIEHLGLTQVSSMIGTPGYMAPEQYVGEGIDHRADLFAAGVLLYRLLAGRPAFSGAAEVVMYKILNEQPPPPSQLAARGVNCDAVVARAIAKRADGRYASAGAFREALAAVAAQGGDATVIVPPAYWSRAVEAAAAGAAARPSALTPTAPPTGWDAQALSRIEQVLASHVGPMARLMVRDAARHCGDLASLTATVAQHIAEPERRARFMSAATGPGTGAAPVTAAGTTAGTAAGTESSLGEPLNEALMARAVQLLMRQLGPIAKVVVKRAADKASSKAHFIALLSEAAPEVDAAALARELG